ncbi:MAG: rhomboid family intramembrane serine protease, partial [Desulfitobacteriaceae bacterium]
GIQFDFWMNFEMSRDFEYLIKIIFYSIQGGILWLLRLTTLIMGGLLYYSWQHPDLWKNGFGKNLLVVIAVNLGFGYIQPGIDNYAHLGGLLTGFIFMGLFKGTKNKFGKP